MTVLTEETIELLGAAPAGCLGMSDHEGPYVVPVSFAPGESCLYFHGGQGRKSAALEKDGRVCLAVTSSPALVKGQDPCSDNFDYRSILVFGKARQLSEPAEREAGLRAIIRKYHPEASTASLREATLARTLVYAIDIERVTVKEHPTS